MLLTGFGTQDSHLFPHGFTRGPGNWIYMAQGAFNDGVVKAKDGSETRFRYCKMARFTPDGQKFEIVSAGLNNIWGFVISREGEMFAQEANDLGYPVTEFQIGDNFPGIGNDKLKPYAPFRPAPVSDFQMGGTGLSGLALAEDYDTWPAPYGKVGQASSLSRAESQAGGPRDAQADACVTFLHRQSNHIADPGDRRDQSPARTTIRKASRLRPLLGPVVPPDPHRLRPRRLPLHRRLVQQNHLAQRSPQKPPRTRQNPRTNLAGETPRAEVEGGGGLAAIKSDELRRHFHRPSKWESTASWIALSDRTDVNLSKLWKTTMAQPFIEEANALRAWPLLWALESLDDGWKSGIRKSDLAFIGGQRWNAVRAQIARMSRNMDVLLTLGKDGAPNVRATAFRSMAEAGMIREILECVPSGEESYDKKFLRYIARAELERRPEEVERFLKDSRESEIPVESRLLAILALEPNRALYGSPKLLPQLDARRTTRNCSASSNFQTNRASQRR